MPLSMRAFKTRKKASTLSLRTLCYIRSLYDGWCAGIRISYEDISCDRAYGTHKKKRFNMFCLSGYRVCAEAYNEWVRFFLHFMRVGRCVREKGHRAQHAKVMYGMNFQSSKRQYCVNAEGFHR